MNTSKEEGTKKKESLNDTNGRGLVVTVLINNHPVF